MPKFTFDWNPVLFKGGPIEIRYYGVIFALSLLIGFFFLRWQFKRGKHRPTLADDFILWGVGAVVIGARLGHCLFYEWDRYSQDLMSILYFWEGGLASHGATIGLIVAITLFSLVKRVHPLDIMDRFSFAAACGAAGVRLGNFFNSEIVGRVTDQSWGVIFTRYSKSIGEFPAMYRHPSQLYEFAMGVLILFILLLADRLAKREKRPLGLLTSIFMTVYFAGRFCVEFFKEYQVEGLIEDKSFLTMGQYLSIVPVLLGIALMFWSLKKGRGKTELMTEARVDTYEKAVAELSEKKSAEKKKNK